MTEPKRIDIKEFRELGFLQEANRQFFHPLGLALEVLTKNCGRCGGKGTKMFNGDESCDYCGGSGTVESLGGVWDYRDDPEGMIFGDPSNPDPAVRNYGLDPEKAAYVDAERGNHAAHRFELFGFDELPTFHWAIQPL